MPLLGVETCTCVLLMRAHLVDVVAVIRNLLQCSALLLALLCAENVPRRLPIDVVS